jgi:hypothetical protein
MLEESDQTMVNENVGSRPVMRLYALAAPA